MQQSTITSDIWLQIGMHLKPRHLYKLMQTSKRIKQVVDNEAYWTRVAAHMVWRDCDCMEVNVPRERHYVLPDIEHNLYHMLGLDHGYYWGMERFLKRMDEAIDYFSIEEPDEYGMWWANLKPMSLMERTREWMKEDARRVQKQLTERELNMSMKEVAQKKIIASLSLRENYDENDHIYNELVCELEDDPMPAIYKRKIFRKLDKFLWKSFSTETKQFPTEIVDRICKF